MPLPNLLALIGLVVLLGVVFTPRFLSWIASRRGVEGTAVVISATTSSVMDERRRAYRKLELEVSVPGKAPFRKTVRQHLGWLIGSGPSPGARVRVRVLTALKAVYVVGPADEARPSPEARA